MPENEKTFTYDVEKIDNGYLIHHGEKKHFERDSVEANHFVEAKVSQAMRDHVIACFPKGTAQRLVVTIGVTGKVME